MAQAYTEADTRAALELGARIGRRRAVQELGISSATFQKFTQRMPELWSDLKAQNRQAYRESTAGALEELAEAYMETEAEAVERAATLLPQADAKETAALIKAMGSSRGVAIGNARGLRGETDSTSELNINFPALEQAMARILDAPAPLPVLNEAE